MSRDQTTIINKLWNNKTKKYGVIEHTMKSKVVH